jgi:hypothetical protein
MIRLLDLPAALEIIGALARIDGSDGWTAMIGGGCDMFAPCWPLSQCGIRKHSRAKLGRVAAELRAARAFLRAQAASHWRHALAGTLKDEALLTQGTQTATWLATTCARGADACFALGGSSALYETSPL